MIAPSKIGYSVFTDTTSFVKSSKKLPIVTLGFTLLLGSTLGHASIAEGATTAFLRTRFNKTMVTSSAMASRRGSYYYDIWNNPGASHLVGYVNLGVDSLVPNSSVPTNAVSLSEDGDMGRAFDVIGLSREEGFVFLNKAKEILESTSFSCTATVPCISNDLEEDAKYLTVRLYTNVSFEKSLELDSFLTRKLITSFARLPECISFAVYETDGSAA